MAVQFGYGTTTSFGLTATSLGSGYAGNFNISVAFFVNITSLPSSLAMLWEYYYTGSSQAGVGISSSGQLSIYYDGTAQTPTTGSFSGTAPTLATGQWYFVGCCLGFNGVGYLYVKPVGALTCQRYIYNSGLSVLNLNYFNLGIAQTGTSTFTDGFFGAITGFKCWIGSGSTISTLAGQLSQSDFEQESEQLWPVREADLLAFYPLTRDLDFNSYLGSHIQLTTVASSTPLSGVTFNVTNGSASVTASTSVTTTLVAGNELSFSSQSGVYYVVASVSGGTSVTLTTNYTGTTNTAASATATLSQAPDPPYIPNYRQVRRRLSFGPLQLSVVAPYGIESGEAVGQAFMAPITYVQAYGIESGEALGSTDIAQLVKPYGIPTGEALGSPICTPIVVVEPYGIESGEALGAPSMPTVTAPYGIESGEALGPPSLLPFLEPYGIETGEALGPGQIWQNFAPSGIESGEALGPGGLVQFLVFVEPYGIESGEALGPGTAPLLLQPYGVETGEALGAGQTWQNFAPSGIESGEALGQAHLTQLFVQVFLYGIESGEALGAPSFLPFINAYGIESGEALGPPEMTPITIYDVSGAITGTCTVSASLYDYFGVSGTAAGSSTATVNTGQLFVESQTIGGMSGVVGTIVPSNQVSGEADGFSYVVTNLTGLIYNFENVSTGGSSSLSGTVELANGISGQANGAATLFENVSTIYDGVRGISGSATVTGTLELANGIAGEADGAATVSLGTVNQLYGYNPCEAVGAATVTGDIEYANHISGSATGSVTLTVNEFHLMAEGGVAGAGATVTGGLGFLWTGRAFAPSYSQVTSGNTELGEGTNASILGIALLTATARTVHRADAVILASAALLATAKGKVGSEATLFALAALVANAHAIRGGRANLAGAATVEAEAEEVGGHIYASLVATSYLTVDPNKVTLIHFFSQGVPESAKPTLPEVRVAPQTGQALPPDLAILPGGPKKTQTGGVPNEG